MTKVYVVEREACYEMEVDGVGVPVRTISGPFEHTSEAGDYICRLSGVGKGGSVREGVYEIWEFQT